MKRVFFLLNAAFVMAILDLISCVHLASFTMLPKYLEHSPFSSCFWSIIICTAYGSLEILFTYICPTFISIPQHFPVSISLSIMPCSTVSSSGSSIRSSVYYTVWIACSLPTCEHFHTILKFIFWDFYINSDPNKCREHLHSKGCTIATAETTHYNILPKFKNKQSYTSVPTRCKERIYWYKRSIITKDKNCKDTLSSLSLR